MKSELPLAIEELTYWMVSPPKDFSEFLRHLPSLVPNDSILCLDTVLDSDIKTFLEQKPAKYENETNQGFFSLSSNTYYMPVTEENLLLLADLSENYAEPEVCSNLLVYHNDRVILSWYDLPSDPFDLANDIDEAALKRFCEVLGCTYAGQAKTI